MDEVYFDRELEGTTKLITSLNINQESASLKPGLLMMNTGYHSLSRKHTFFLSFTAGDSGWRRSFTEAAAACSREFISI